MIEDKLNPEQRIRLEALSQAVQLTLGGAMSNMVSAMAGGGPSVGSSAEVVVDTAARLERFIRDGVLPA